MEVRGNVISGINDFVKASFPDRYDEWFEKMSDDSKAIYQKVSPMNWYAVNEAVIEPTRTMCKMFFPNEKKGAWESGRHSAELALKGIYKIFVLISSPAFIMKRATRILPTFYKGTEIELVDSSSKSLFIHIRKLSVNDRIVEYRIAGWMEKAMEICGCKNLRVISSKTTVDKEDVTTIKMGWD